MARRGNVLNPLIAAILIVFGGAVVASRAWHSARTFHPRLNIPRPPLASARPFIDADHPALSRRVVIVVIDGLRLDASFGNPWLDGLRRIGAEAVGRAPFPSWSRSNQAAILTGVPPIASGIRSNDFSFDVVLDSLMDRANARGLRSAYVADVSFGMARMFHADFEASHYVPWRGGLEKAIRLVVRQEYPLLVIIPGAVDEAGHEHGADSNEYLEAIREVDRLLAETLAGLDLARDTLIVTADHGHTDDGGHGGTERVVLEVPVILAGAGIRPGAALGDVGLIDLAPTAATLLGVPAPGHSIGRTILPALLLDDPDRAALVAEDAKRVARNLDVLDRHATAAKARALEVRVPRLVGVGFALTFAAAVLVVLIHYRIVSIGGRSLVIGLPAFPLTFYLLVELIGGRFSLSSVPDRPGAIDQIFYYAAIATVVQIIASWVALNGHSVPRERLAAAAGLALTELLGSWLPAGLLWALYDPESQPVLASSHALVLAPAAWVAVAFIALASAVTVGVEIIVFFARGLDPRVRLARLRRATARARAALEEDGEHGG